MSCTWVWVVYDEEARETFDWFCSDVVNNIFNDDLPARIEPIPMHDLDQWWEKKAAPPAGAVRVLFVVLFWDAFSASSKSAYIRIKAYAEEPCEVQPSGDQLPVLLHILNGKRGNAVWKSSPDTIVTSVRALAAHRQHSPSLSAARHVDPSASSTAVVHPESPQVSSYAAAVRVEAITTALHRGSRECFFTLNCSSSAELQQAEELLHQNCKTLCTGVSVVKQRSPMEVEYFLRQHQCSVGDAVELRIAMCGNVDSGKSTLTAVLTHGCLDNGKGFARSFVFQHKHEQATGRTSSVSEYYLGFSSSGELIRGAEDRPATAHHSSYQPQYVTENSDKVVALCDLAGHEKYLKTTILGMTRRFPDYACVVISANNGIQRMTKEHLILCLALKLPFYIVVTRVDVTPPNVTQETMNSIGKMLKSKAVRRSPFLVKELDDVVMAAKQLRHLVIVPIVQLSCVTGEGVNLLTRLLHYLPVLHHWAEERHKPQEMIIDRTFHVTGVGTVVGGVIMAGVFRPQDTVMLGPNSVGLYRAAVIKSIQVRGVNVAQVGAGSDAALCLKKEKRSDIRSGNVLLANTPSKPPQAYWRFDTEVTILYHATTIQAGYEPIIHTATALQAARILKVEKEVLRTGDSSVVTCHFLYRPEYVKLGQRILFREGKTKGVGVITSITQEADVMAMQQCKRDWKRRIVWPGNTSGVA